MEPEIRNSNRKSQSDRNNTEATMATNRNPYKYNLAKANWEVYGSHLQRCLDLLRENLNERQDTLQYVRELQETIMVDQHSHRSELNDIRRQKKYKETKSRQYEA